MTTTTGLEITTDALKYVTVGRRGRRREILAWGRIPVETEAELGTALEQLARNADLSTHALKVAIGTQSTHLRVHAFPAMPANELGAVVEGEIARELELLSGEMASGWQLLQRQKGKGRTSVLVSLTPKQGIDRVRGTFLQHGLVPDLLTTSSLALFGHVRRRSDLGAPGGCFGVLHIGLERMVLALVEGETFRLLRDLGVGIDASLLGGPGGGDEAEFDLDNLDSLSRGLDAMNLIARQIKRTLEYDARQNPTPPVSRLFLAGEAASAEAMAPLLANELQIPVALLDPLAGADFGLVDLRFVREAPSYALPLALARATDPSEILNLGPARRVDPVARWTGAAITAAALVTALSVAAVPIDARLEQLRAQRDALQENRAALPHEEQDAGVSFQAAARRNQVPLEPLLWLGDALPVEARVQSISVDRSLSGWEVAWEGTVRSHDPDRRLAAWAEFQTKLEADARVSGVELVPLEGESGSRRDLPLDGTLHLEARP
ncbi:MAG: hypothetical protein IT349_14790 [Candidatus Eisenbacteria bacterium]|nr:hypothetical protein [Candidatus Eisenbacteria bacterium]MCC7143363.1 hypothetical protein [Candidatus Eisenbacteria bacterium]